jgi:hypothetical protein
LRGRRSPSQTQWLPVLPHLTSPAPRVVSRRAASAGPSDPHGQGLPRGRRLARHALIMAHAEGVGYPTGGVGIASLPPDVARILFGGGSGWASGGRHPHCGRLSFLPRTRRANSGSTPGRAHRGLAL